jgi:hypothetical protein
MLALVKTECDCKKGNVRAVVMVVGLGTLMPGSGRAGGCFISDSRANTPDERAAGECSEVVADVGTHRHKLSGWRFYPDVLVDGMGGSHFGYYYFDSYGEPVL